MNNLKDKMNIAFKAYMIIGGAIALALVINTLNKSECVGVCAVDYTSTVANVGSKLLNEGSPTTAQVIKHNANKGTKTGKVFLVEYNTAFTLDQSEQFNQLIAEVEGASMKGDTLAIKITSPGGSSVGCASNYHSILRLKKNGIKVVSVIDYYAYSCGYYLAAASDVIYADYGAQVGNIGSVLMKRTPGKGPKTKFYGNTRNKEILAGDMPKNSTEESMLRDMAKSSGKLFINDVLRIRGSKISKSNYDIVFSALPFNAVKAKELGLIDENASSSEVLKGFYINGYSITKLTYRTKKPKVWDLLF